MPQVRWPTGAVVSNLDISVHAPGDITLEPVRGGKPVVIQRGYSTWRMSAVVQIDPIPPGDDDAVNNVIPMLAELGSRPDNWTEMPVDLRSIGDANDPIIAGFDASGTIATLSADPGRLAPGRWFRSGYQSFLVESASGLDITWQPGWPLALSAPVLPLATIRVRMVDQPVMPHSFAEDGPYSLTFESYPYT